MNNEKNKQIIRGDGNSNYNVNELNIQIKNDYNDYIVNAADFFNSYCTALDDYDKYIKELIGEKIIVNKTNKEEDFSASKILKSLLTIGIPLDATFVIFKEAIEKIIAYKGANDEHKLDTKTIRKIVCDSIQSYNLKNYAPSQIQSWSQKYVRKYGRNNQVIKIQHENGSLTEISMDFLKTFVDDVIKSISPNIVVKKISNTSRRELAECVLDFVNSCDIYIIRYNVLKDIILEIALQPPHPWFINEDTKSNIINYDCTQLKINLAKAKNYFNKGTIVIPPSILYEIIHHASSMILAKYDYYLGCNDLSSLYLLKSLLENLINIPYEDLLFDEYPINTLLSDIAKAKINCNDYLKLIKSICEEVNTSAINMADFSDKVNIFGKLSLKILENNVMLEINKFYETEWNEYSLNEIMDNIKLFMNASFGENEIKVNYTKKDSNYFWYRLSKFESNVLAEIKKNIFVFFGKDISTDLNSFISFNNKAHKIGCNMIMLISETSEVSRSLKESIEKIFYENKCPDDVLIIDLGKKELASIFYSNNPPRSFEDILFNKFFNS